MTPLRVFPLGLLLLASTAAGATDQPPELRVCADADNLPFSNERLEGFENKIAALVADDLHVMLRYAWNPQGRDSMRQILSTGKCDVLIGAPLEWSAVLTTRPYYSSSYVFVYLEEKYPGLSSFDDHRLSKSKIGLPLVSGGGANSPAAYALARHGFASQVVGFPMFPPSKIIDAVANNEIDAAIVWGPYGGYFAKRERKGIAVTPVAAGNEDSSFRFTYAISMGVRRGETALKDSLEKALDRRHNEVTKILEEYNVPLIPTNSGGALTARSIQ